MSGRVRVRKGKGGRKIQHGKQRYQERFFFLQETISKHNAEFEEKSIPCDMFFIFS